MRDDWKLFGIVAVCMVVVWVVNVYTIKADGKLLTAIIGIFALMVKSPRDVIKDIKGRKRD